MRSAGGVLGGPGPDLSSAPPLRPGAARGPSVPGGGTLPPRRLGTRSARRSGRETRPRIPRAPPSPLSLPPLGGPLRETGGAYRSETIWGGVESSARKAPPPRVAAAGY